jgi:hypothetical protein
VAAAKIDIEVFRLDASSEGELPLRTGAVGPAVGLNVARLVAPLRLPDGGARVAQTKADPNLVCARARVTHYVRQRKPSCRLRKVAERIELGVVIRRPERCCRFVLRAGRIKVGPVWTPASYLTTTVTDDAKRYLQPDGRSPPTAFWAA